MRGIRNYFRRLAHRDAVLDNLAALLLAYPRGRQFGADFPWLKEEMRALHAAGVAGPQSALQLSEKIIGNFVGQLNAIEKERLAEALLETGHDGFAALAERRAKRERDETKDRLIFLSRLIGVALFMAGRMADQGVIARPEAERFVERIAALVNAEATRMAALAGLQPPT